MLYRSRARNFHEIRLRLGGRWAAAQRLAAFDTWEATLDLVTAQRRPDLQILRTPGPVSVADLKGRRILLGDLLDGFDLAFAYAHELGHFFDIDCLTDDHRSRFAGAVGTGAAWNDEHYCDSVCEAWATAFALNACPGPWWCSHWFPANWPQARTCEVLSTCRAVTEAALRTERLEAGAEALRF